MAEYWLSGVVSTANDTRRVRWAKMLRRQRTRQGVTSAATDVQTIDPLRRLRVKLLNVLNT